MNYKGPLMAAIFFMTTFKRDKGGHAPPPSSAAVILELSLNTHSSSALNFLLDTPLGSWPGFVLMSSLQIKLEVKYTLHYNLFTSEYHHIEEDIYSNNNIYPAFLL